MTELASAVALPEHDNDNSPPSPDSGMKRRKSSTTNADADADTSQSPDTKRRRLSSQDHSHARRPSAQSQSPETRKSERRPSRQTQTGRPGRGRDEERKRGQRLFGALLGTLSQGSNSAQKRRADIEKRQQDKMKVRYEEFDEERRKRRDEVVALRVRERGAYEREEMQTRHSNLRAMALFLKTKAEPVLYYKPWELRPEEEDIIRDQIDETEARISREVADFEARQPQEEDTQDRKTSRQEETEKNKDGQMPEPDEKESGDAAREPSDMGGAETSPDKNSEGPRTDGAPVDSQNTAPEHPDNHRTAEDDGGVVVEDKEDTVIY